MMAGVWIQEGESGVWVEGVGGGGENVAQI